MGDLYKNIQKKKTEFKQTELQKNMEALQRRRTAERGFGEDDNVIGGAPFEPVPKEARKKTLSGMAGSLFHRRKDALVGEGKDPAAMGEPTDLLTEEEPKVELENVYTEFYEDYKQKQIDMYDLLQTDINENKVLESVSEETKKHLLAIRDLTGLRSGKNTDLSEDRYDETLTSVDFFAEYSADMKEVTEGKTQEEIDKRYAKFLEKYETKYKISPKDHEILGTYSNMFKDAHGNLTAEEIKKKGEIVDTTKGDDYFRDPAVYKLDSPATYEGHTYVESLTVMHESKSPLFAKDPTPNDVRQGNIGDCYFIAALNAITEKDPEYIKNMMKDNGDSVTVRFFKPSGAPIYVTVKKTIPVRAFRATDGHIRENVFMGAMNEGAPLWVGLLEKAFASIRPRLEDDMDLKEKAKDQVHEAGHVYATLDSGTIKTALRMLMGPDAALKKELRVDKIGKSFVKKSISGSGLARSMRSDTKSQTSKEMKEQGKKLSNVDWNLKKAELFFGVKIKDDKDPLYRFFKNDTLFRTMEEHIANVLREKFTSETLRTENDALVLVDYLKNNLKKIPAFNIPNCDEEALKKHYLNYMVKYINTSGKLSLTVNKSGEYTEKEDEVYEKLLDAKAKDQIIMVETDRFRFAEKKGKGRSAGEKVVLGVAGGHAYNIRDVLEEERTIGGKKVKQRFVIIVNPWKDSIRQYDKDGNPYVMKNDKKKKINTGGAFKMELRDFITTYKTIRFQ